MPEERSQNQGKLNLNSASREEITNGIEGVGSETAQTIVNYRENNGRIENYEDLSNIKGIDHTMIDKIKNNASL